MLLARLPAPWLPLVLAAAALQDGPSDEADTARHANARELFRANCASCHGETGDGDGWTELDRPARSFKQGGFSFGNTPEALFRTISAGIPGTPMPAFDASLDEAARRELADYVLELGPPPEAIDTSRAVITVRDRPRIVRGHLPPIVDSASARPRGLLVGTTSGLTFEYRVDDVRLLGVRLGEFVRRSDWVGRGGTPLEPLGGVLHVLERGDPRPTFAIDDGAAPRPLAARLEGTWALAADAGLRYRLEDAEGRVRADVSETPTGRVTSRGSVFERRFSIRAAADVPLVVRVPLLEALPILEQVVPPPLDDAAVGRAHWVVQRSPDGAFVCSGSTLPPGAALVVRAEGLDVSLRLSAGETVALALHTVVAPMWTDEIRRALDAGGPR